MDTGKGFIMFNWLKSIFKKKPQSQTQIQGQVGNIKKIALLVGHGAGDSGAIGFNKVQEHAYNSFVAEFVAQSDVKKELKVFYKAQGGWALTYLKVATYNPDLTIELHLNAANGKAVGCEVLCLDGDENSAIIGRRFALDFTGKFNRRMRGDKGIKWISSSGRGFGNLVAAKKTSPRSILVEPFFIDTREEWIAQAEYAEFLKTFINNLG